VGEGEGEGEGERGDSARRCILAGELLGVAALQMEERVGMELRSA